MNIIPMIPLAKFADMEPPSDAEVNRMRDECETVIKQFRNCMRCRADAIGVPGEEGCGGSDDTLPGQTVGDGQGCGSKKKKQAPQVCTPKFMEGKATIPLTKLDMAADETAR